MDLSYDTQLRQYCELRRRLDAVRHPNAGDGAMWECRRHRTIYRRHPRPRLVAHLHFRRDLRNETGAATTDFWRQVNIRVDPAPPPGTIRFRDRAGRLLGSIVNIGTGRA